MHVCICQNITRSYGLLIKLKMKNLLFSTNYSASHSNTSSLINLFSLFYLRRYTRRFICVSVNFWIVILVKPQLHEMHVNKFFIHIYTAECRGLRKL